MSDKNTVMIDGKPLHIASNEVMAIIDGKLSDDIKRQVLNACPHIRGPVARIQLLTPNESNASSTFSAETTQAAKALIKSCKAEHKSMSRSYDQVDSKLEHLINDNQANELLSKLIKED